MSNVVLKIKNLIKYYDKVKVVDDVSFSLNEGEILGFLGPNGAGKTTTIKMILGMISIDSGSIEVAGFNIKQDFEKAMENIGGIVENPDMYEYMSAVDNLKLFAKMRNINYKRVYEVLELVGLEKSMNQKFQKYSLGMKQRAGLALCLLHNPKILILDEPTNGLDPVGIKELRDILQKIKKEYGTSVLVSSHILTEMQLMCDRVVVINKGKIVKEEVINIEKLEENGETIKVKCVIKTANNEKAMEVLSKRYVDNNISIRENKLIIEINKGEVSEIIKLLVKEDIAVEYINENEHMLEDIFMDATKEGKNNE